MPDAVDAIVAHIHANLAALPQRPLFVALQGPQGSGKTYTTARVAAALESASLRTAALSIDDLYLPHAGLLARAAAHPHNGLLRGRGQPGTHDVPLGAAVLRALKTINASGEGAEVRLPAFDKGAHGGAGDRVPAAQWRAVRGPLDVVLLEGWCVGFFPQARADIARRAGEAPVGLDGVLDMGQFALEDVLEINELLAPYVAWWDMFDVFAQIAPQDDEPYVHIYKWRLEQEHAMLAQNGGKGMSDEEVKAFVDRYIPGYHFFGMGVVAGGQLPGADEHAWPTWLPHDAESRSKPARMLQIVIDENRNVLEVRHKRRNFYMILGEDAQELFQKNTGLSGEEAKELVKRPEEIVQRIRALSI